MGLKPLEGRLVRLRAREPEDEPQLYRWFNDPEVTQFLALRYPLSHTQEKEFIESQKAPGYEHLGLAVEALSDGALVGGVDLSCPRPEYRLAVLGIAIGDKARWDAGYGSDTMRTVCRFGFEMMNLHRIELEVYAENHRARRVYEKVGFREEGRRRDALYKFGRYADVVMMGLLEGELRLED